MSQPDRPRVREAPFGYTVSQIPGAQEALTAFSKAIWSDEGSVPAMTKELVFLRTSIVNKCVG